MRETCWCSSRVSGRSAGPTKHSDPDGSRKKSVSIYYMGTLLCALSLKRLLPPLPEHGRSFSPPASLRRV